MDFEKHEDEGIIPKHFLNKANSRTVSMASDSLQELLSMTEIEEKKIMTKKGQQVSEKAVIKAKQILGGYIK